MKQLYFSTTDASMVVPVTAQIQLVLQSRHRPESVYKVENLTQLVAVADKTANALTMVLLAVALVVLLVSGIGIMNIMLATVSPVSFRGRSDFAHWRTDRHFYRTRYPLLCPLFYRIPHSHLGPLGDHRDRRVVFGWSYLRHASCQPRRPA
ncbi:MAG: hypothetical protein AUI36_25510 [Cyanobacteria bacterium 13_1_40CM_2_61_4]|nr:MAG: hypothetical protein AUI36_25510 [Cyanobacteria bacterium 13_1_40CM_2_61_4]